MSYFSKKINGSIPISLINEPTLKKMISLQGRIENSPLPSRKHLMSTDSERGCKLSKINDAVQQPRCPKKRMMHSIYQTSKRENHQGLDLQTKFSICRTGGTPIGLLKGASKHIFCPQPKRFSRALPPLVHFICKKGRTSHLEELFLGCLIRDLLCITLFTFSGRNGK